jgi:uncharacterized protein (TIGR02246 family)
MWRRSANILVALTALSMTVSAQNGGQEEQEIRSTLQVFYDGWNAHDIDKIVSVYADDIDHINVMGVWHKGKAEIRDDITRLTAAGLAGHKNFTIEKIRMLKPDIAVVQVKSISNFCNLGTYVMSKQTGKWLVISFTNVNCNQTNVPKY